MNLVVFCVFPLTDGQTNITSSAKANIEWLLLPSKIHILYMLLNHLIIFSLLSITWSRTLLFLRFPFLQWWAVWTPLFRDSRNESSDEWHPRCLGEHVTSKVSIRAFSSVTLGSTSSRIFKPNKVQRDFIWLSFGFGYFQACREYYSTLCSWERALQHLDWEFCRHFDDSFFFYFVRSSPTSLFSPSLQWWLIRWELQGTKLQRMITIYGLGEVRKVVLELAQCY